jgi:hypothetical protein
LNWQKKLVAVCALCQTLREKARVHTFRLEVAQIKARIHGDERGWQAQSPVVKAQQLIFQYWTADAIILPVGRIKWREPL